MPYIKLDRIPPYCCGCMVCDDDMYCHSLHQFVGDYENKPADCPIIEKDLEGEIQTLKYIIDAKDDELKSWRGSHLKRGENEKLRELVKAIERYQNIWRYDTTSDRFDKLEGIKEKIDALKQEVGGNG